MVIPIGDINPTRRRAFVLWSLFAINVGVFGYQALVLQGCEQLAFVYRWAAIPRELLTGTPLSEAELGPLLGECAPLAGDKNVWLPVLTALFLHGGPAHLIGNMVFLGVFGDNVEDRLGHLRFLLFYLVGGGVATAVFVALQPSATVPLVGASGAIAAVLGAYLICFPRARVLAIVPFPLYLAALLLPGVRIQRWLIIMAVVVLPAWLMLSGWFVVQAMAANDPVGDMVAYEAHVAGFIAGIVLVLLLDMRRSRHGQPAFHPGRRRQPPAR
jgi:membrane associated rhomboid family serine protease